MPRPPARSKSLKHRSSQPPSDGRVLAYRALRFILEDGHSLDEALREGAGLAPRERAFAHTLVASTLRRLGEIDVLIARFLKEPFAGLAPDARALLRLGTTQSLILKTPAHAAVAATVDVAKAEADTAKFLAEYYGGGVNYRGLMGLGPVAKVIETLKLYEAAGVTDLCIRIAGTDQVAQMETFVRDVAPVIYAKCGVCHRPGGSGPFSLLTYAEARQHARQIATVTQRGYMPPYLADAHVSGPFMNQPRLTDAELRRAPLDGVVHFRLSPITRLLVAESAAVLARLGTADQHTAVVVDPDRLAAAGR